MNNGIYTPDSPPEGRAGWFSRERVLALALIVATVVAFYLCYQLTLPFLPALAWALALAVVARPLHDWIAARVRQPDLAAGLTVAAVIVIIVVPFFFVAQRVTVEAANITRNLQQESAEEKWRAAIDGIPWLAPTVHTLEQNIDLRREIHQASTAIAPRLDSLLTNSLWTIMQMLVAVFALFFFLRDRRGALKAVRSLIPLSHTEADQAMARVGDTIHATVYGMVLCAILQGSLGALIFWLLGIPAPMLWGLVMALLAMVPYLGSFLVWTPAAIYLVMEGHWVQALVLIVWGLVVIGLSDNLIYPFLVGKRMRLHTLPVFIAIVGGVIVFGGSGVILGPVILAITDALIDIWRRRMADGGTVEDGVQKEDHRIITEEPKKEPAGLG